MATIFAQPLPLASAADVNYANIRYMNRDKVTSLDGSLSSVLRESPGDCFKMLITKS